MAVMFLWLGFNAGVGQTADASLPPIVAGGLQTMQEGRCRDAFEQWTTHWTSPEDSIKKQQLTSSCDILSQIGGALKGYDTVRVVRITPHFSRSYILLRYEKQPVFLALVAYAAVDGQWKVATLNWNTDPDKVFPSAILAPLKPEN